MSRELKRAEKTAVQTGTTRQLTTGLQDYGRGLRAKTAKCNCNRNTRGRSEIRRPKPERRPRSEIRNPKPETEFLHKGNKENEVEKKGSKDVEGAEKAGLMQTGTTRQLTTRLQD